MDAALGGPGVVGVVDVEALYGDAESETDAVTRRWLERVERPLAAISRESGPAEERLRRWLDTLIRTKQKKRRDDPEMFATYYQLAQEATSIVDQHVTELIDQLGAIVADGQAAGVFTVTDTEAAARAVFHATARFHHPARASAWDDATIDEQFEAVWGLVRRGLKAKEPSRSEA